MSLHVFQLASTGDYVILSAANSRAARQMLAPDFCDEADIVEIDESLTDLIDDSYDGVAFLSNTR